MMGCKFSQEKLLIILQLTKQNCLHLKEKFWNIPNSLSLYRLLIFPVMLYWIITRKEDLVAIFIAVNLFTDWLDGIIARGFNMQTKIGARLDSWADTGTYICAFLAIYYFKWEEIKPHSIILYIYFSLWLLSYVIVFIKFRGLIGMHTYLSKATGYIQGAFIVILFLFGFYPLLFYAGMFAGLLALLEEIIIIIKLKGPKTNVKGLYWLRKNNDW
jgi:cardiolipin synthase